MKFSSSLPALCLLLVFVFAGCAKQDSRTASNLAEDEILAEHVQDDIDLLLDDAFDDWDDNDDEDISYPDPLEPMNRFFFVFNDKLYYWVLKPVNTVYTAIIPFDFRVVIGNFVNNLSAPVRLLNNLLQGKFADSGVVLSRFLINSTLGIAGLGDPAFVEFGLTPKPEDFGQTLAVWGVGEGVYLCWPVIGPSNVRDTFGFAGDVYSHPMVYYVDDFSVSAGYYVGSRVNLLSLNPDVYEDLKKYSLDPYVSMRQLYLDYRRHKIGDQVVLQKSDNSL